jgi:replicative DNA helicase
MEELRDVAAERAVLGAVCTYGADAWVDVSDLVSGKSFAVDSNQTIWACLGHVFAGDPKAVVDYPTLMSAARALGLDSVFDRPEEQAHLRAVMNFPVKPENARGLAKVLRKLEFARDALGVVEDVRADLATVTGAESIDAILAKVEGPVLGLSSLLNKAGGGPSSMGEGIRDYAAHLAAHKRDVVGIPSGFPGYDRAIGGGFRPATVNCVGARPGVGKTLLGMNIGVRVASGAGYNWPACDPAAQVPVLYLDTEMTREDQQTRMLAMLSGVTINDVETGRYARDPVKLRAIGDAIDKLESIPYDFLSIAGQPFDETEGVMRRWVTKRVGLENGAAKPCLVIFDYLKLMDTEQMSSAKLAEFQVLGFMMTKLHNFAVRYKVPVLSFVQLNRDGINLEDTSAVSQSDRIIWLCSNFSIYKPKSDEEMAEQTGTKVKYNRKLIPLKTRHGAGLGYGDYVNVMSHGSVARIVEGPTRDELQKGASLDGSSPTGEIVVSPDSGQVQVDFNSPAPAAA